MQNETALYAIDCNAVNNDYVPYGCLHIDWNGTAGFGQFEIHFDEHGIAHIYSEHMCSQNDKLFAYKIVKRMIDEAIVEE